MGHSWGNLIQDRVRQKDFVAALVVYDKKGSKQVGTPSLSNSLPHNQFCLWLDPGGGGGGGGALVIVSVDGEVTVVTNKCITSETKSCASLLFIVKLRP